MPEHRSRAKSHANFTANSIKSTRKAALALGFCVLGGLTVFFHSEITRAIATLMNEALPKNPPTPKDNATTPAKVKLGAQLYFDPRLSKDGTVSCNSCHNVMSNGTDGLRTSAGVGAKRGGRNSPTVWNAAFMSVQFWDGRAASLEEQAKGPLVNPIEMAMADHKAVVKRIEEIPGYRDSFKQVFDGSDPITIDNVAKAIAAFERTLATPNSAFDRYRKGDKKALSTQQIRGYEVAQTVGCFSCHSGPNFAGPVLPEGTGFFQQFPKFENNEYVKKYDFKKDTGRYEVTKKSEDKHFWRVPTWRNIAVTAPYFHNGSVETLEEAVRVMSRTQLDKELSTREVEDIVAFMQSLTGEFPRIEMPRLPDTSGFSLVISSVK